MVEDQSHRFFVAVHVGAGYHAPSNEKALRSAMKRACLAASTVLHKVTLSLSLIHTQTDANVSFLVPFKFNPLEENYKISNSKCTNFMYLLFEMLLNMCTFVSSLKYRKRGTKEHCEFGLNSNRNEAMCWQNIWQAFFFSFLLLLECFSKRGVIQTKYERVWFRGVCMIYLLCSICFRALADA